MFPLRMRGIQNNQKIAPALHRLLNKNNIVDPAKKRILDLMDELLDFHAKRASFKDPRFLAAERALKNACAEVGLDFDPAKLR